MSLNTKIKDYLVSMNIVFNHADYQTGRPHGEEDQILFWDETKLGSVPTTQQLNNAYDAAEIKRQQDALTEPIRSERNKLLADTDWTQIDDSPVNKEDWATYRQALRDIPQQDGFPTTIVWPVKPE